MAKSGANGMFRGLTAVTLDIKGRLAIPAKVRECLAEYDTHNELVVTIDTMEKCLLMYPLVIWEKIEQTLEKLPNLDASARRLQRLLLGHASEIQPDANGRIVLPSLLREYAQLDKQAVVVGQGNKLEIWDALSWEHQREQLLAAKTLDSNLSQLHTLSL